MSHNDVHVLVPSSDYESDLLAEIKFRKSLAIEKQTESIVWIKGPKQTLWWPQWQLNHVQRIKFDSISQAVRILKSEGKFWLNLDHKWHRRSSLIQDALPKIKKPNVVRGQTIAPVASGAWFLEDTGLLCFSKEISIPYKNGIVPIADDKTAPSRAYRKLDEVFARLQKFPAATETALDLGSHPGGWTWVLSQLCRKVFSVDTVALSESVSIQKNVHFIKRDAFKLSPIDVGPVDWFFSDIICEPVKLLELIQLWKNSNLVKNFVCTIKFKGVVDFKLLEEFLKIPNSQIFHLNANKHELTWVCLN